MIKRLSKMRSKIILRVTAAFFSCVFLPVLLFLIFSFSHIERMVSQTRVDSIQDSLLEFEQTFRSRLQYYDEIISSIARSEELNNYLAAPQNPMAEERVRSYFDEFTLAQSGVYQWIRVYTYAQADYRLSGFSHTSAVEREDWYIDFFAAGVSEKWYSNPAATDSSLIKIKRLYDSSGTELGIMTVNIALQQVTYASAYSLKNRQALFAISADGEWIYHADNAQCYLDITDRMDDFRSILYRIQPGNVESRRLGGSIIAVKRLSDFEILLGSSIDSDDYPDGYAALRVTTLFTVLVLIVFTTIFYYYMFKIITTIKRDVRQVEDYVENNLSGRLQIRYNDEIGEIEQQYNSLLGKIEKLTKNIVLKERLRKNAEIAMLQSQMNPHFIYNAINHFRMQSEINGDYDMANSIAKFGKLIRYNMMNRDYMTTLQQELNSLQYFIDLELLRFSNQLECEVVCQDGISDAKVPKSILQPIIENSIKYGKRSGRVLHIRVSISAVEGDICISIRDDGAGASAATVQSLNSQFQSGYYIAALEMDASTKIGLKNINQRLCLIYDDSYHITVKSRQSEFFEVLIRLPLEWQ